MIKCSTCVYGEARESMEGKIWMCRDEEVFINKADGEWCCRYHLDAITEEEYYGDCS